MLNRFQQSGLVARLFDLPRICDRCMTNSYPEQSGSCNIGTDCRHNPQANWRSSAPTPSRQTAVAVRLAWAVQCWMRLGGTGGAGGPDPDAVARSLGTGHRAGDTGAGHAYRTVPHKHVPAIERSLAFSRHYVANATWPACDASHTVIPAKAGTHAAWVPAFAGMTGLCGVCYIMPHSLGSHRHALHSVRPSAAPATPGLTIAGRGTVACPVWSCTGFAGVAAGIGVPGRCGVAGRSAAVAIVVAVVMAHPIGQVAVDRLVAALRRDVEHRVGWSGSILRRARTTNRCGRCRPLRPCRTRCGRTFRRCRSGRDGVVVIGLALGQFLRPERHVEIVIEVVAVGRHKPDRQPMRWRNASSFASGARATAT